MAGRRQKTQARPVGIVRTATLNIVTTNPVDAAEQVRAIAARLDGFVVNSTIKGDERSRSAAVQLRVPCRRRT